MEFHESKDNGLDISTSWEECKDASFVESKMTDPVMALNEQERLVEKKLLHKIDFLIMPLVILVYILNFLDRSNFAAAKLQGLPEDLNLTSNDYQIALSILYVGYILMQVPSNALLNLSGRPSLYIGSCTVLWGLVSLLTSLVKDYTGIVVARFFLGVVEAPFFCGVLFYLSCWYTRAELSLRMTIFFAGSLLSNAFGGLVAAGILSGLNNARGLHAWQWLYIVEGSVTIAVGIVIVLVLPDLPENWKALSPEMKSVAVRRITLDGTEADAPGTEPMSQWQGIKLAFTDPKTYILAGIYHGVVGMAAISNFFPTLTESLGFGRVISLLLVAPPFVLITAIALMYGFISDRKGVRFWFFVCPVPVVIIGALLFMFTDSFGARYFSLFLLVFIYTMSGIIYAWMASSIPRPRAKRAVALAFINCFGNIASAWTPFIYTAESAPHFRLAMGVNIGLISSAAILAVVLKLVLEKENRQLAIMDGSNGKELSERDLANLERMARLEGISPTQAKQQWSNFRYTI